MLNRKFYLPLILFLGLALRLVSLNQSLWLDEATSILVARNFDFSQIVGVFSPGDFHPPFYYLLLKLWITIFGSSEVAARLLSVLFGVGTIYLVYLIGKAIFSNRIGLFGALFLAAAPLHIYYSQEVRMYVPATFLTCLVAFFFIRTLQKPIVMHWLELVLASVLLLYTDYPPVFLLMSLVVFLLLRGRDHLKRYAKQWILTMSSVIFLFAPWLPTLADQLQSGLLVKANAPGWWQVLGGTSLKQLLLVPIKFTIGRISAYDKYLYVALVSGPLFFFGFLFSRTLKFWRETQFLWFWLTVPVLFAAIFGLKLSIFSYFRLIFVLPAFYLLLAYSALSLGRWSKVAVVGILFINLFASGIYLFNPRFHREDWRSAVSWVDQQPIRERAAAVFVNKNQRDPYFYYAERIPAYGPDVLEQDSFATIYLFRYVQPILDPQDKVRERVEAMGYKKQEERDFNGIVVWRYTK